MNILEINESIILTLFFMCSGNRDYYLFIGTPEEGKESNCKSCRYLADFIYFSHPLFILILRHIGITDNTPLFLVTVLSSTLVGFLLMRLNNKVINQFII